MAGIDTRKPKKTLTGVLKTLLMLFFVAPGTLFFGTLAIARRRRNPFDVGRRWARFVLSITGGKVRVWGASNLNPHESYVFVANHQSIFDILALMAYLPAPFRWLAKKELFRIPFFGQSMRSIGCIPVDRNKSQSGVRSLIQALKEVRNGSSVMIFPEGSRSADGSIRVFKPGAFFLALRSGVPVAPVAIIGARDMMPRDSISVRPCEMKIVIGPPIPVAGMKMTKEQLAQKAWEDIASAVDRYGKTAPVTALSS